MSDEASPRKPDSFTRKLASRAFILAAWFSLMASIGLPAGWLTGDQFITLATLILTLYLGADYLKKREGVDE